MHLCQPHTHLAGEYIHDIQRVKKANGPIKKWAMDLKQRALKIRNKMARKYLLKCSTYLAIRGVQLKTVLPFPLMPLECL